MPGVIDEPNGGSIATSILDDLIMVGLALVSMFLLVFEVISDLSPHQRLSLRYADGVICFVFLSEFTFRLIRSPQRAVFLRRHWWELLASIPIYSPATQALRGLRVFRLLRLIRLLRLVRFMVRFRVLLAASIRFAEQTYLIYIATLAGLVIMSGALGFHYLEAGVNPNVHGLFDSVWWAVVTITTVGYGDIYPITTGGRIIAMVLMLGGIATMSTIAGVIAAHLIKRTAPGAQDQNGEQ